MNSRDNPLPSLSAPTETINPLLQNRGGQHMTPPGISRFKLLRMMPEFRKDALQTFMNLWREMGDVFYYKGLYTAFQLTHPVHIEHVLQTNQKNYRKGRSFSLFKSSIGEGLLISDGETWLRQRRLAQPAFHRQRIASFAKVMTDATEEMLERWQPIAEQGTPLEINAEMMRLTLGIVGRTLFSTDLTNEAEWAGKALSVIREHIMRRMFAVIRLPESLPTPRNRKFREAIRMSDEMIYRAIEDRRRRPGEDNDLLSMLLESYDEESGEHMNDKQLRDEAMTIIGAGYETITQALSWTWYLLSKHPLVERRLRAELLEVLCGRTPTFEDLPKLKYTTMVFEESMRLFPPIYAMSRTAIHDDEIKGFHIPADSEIFLFPYITHRHPDFWENPEGFDPERFSAEKTASRSRYAYFPFGGGPRQCIGNGFAMMEAQMIIATVAQQYSLQLVPGHPVVPEASVTLRPRQGILMTLHETSY
ncbi:MAG TPA: cytochrome P450 [Pyrinomonadaceae bacterium]|jgi:cytochrome P450